MYILYIFASYQNIQRYSNMPMTTLTGVSKEQAPKLAPEKVLALKALRVNFCQLPDR